MVVKYTKHFSAKVKIYFGGPETFCRWKADRTKCCNGCTDIGGRNITNVVNKHIGTFSHGNVNTYKAICRVENMMTL